MRTIRLLVAATALSLLAACSGDPSTIPVSGTVLLEGETNHSGVLVTLAGRSTLTDQAGAWRIELLAGGAASSYVVQASASDTLEGMKVVPVEVPEEGALSVPEIKLTPVGTVAGKVTVGGATGNAGIVVLAVGSSAFAVTDDAGNYVLRNVPTGNRTLEVSAPGFARGQVQVQVTRAGQAAASLVTLARSGQGYKGMVTLLGESSHAGTVVTLAGTDRTATTDATGQFSLNAPDGTYAMTLRNGAYELTIPNVAFVQGTPYLTEAGLVPLPPISLQPARQVARSMSVGRPIDNFLQRTADGNGFVFVSDTSYQNIENGGAVYQGTLRSVPNTGGAPFTFGARVQAYKLTPDGSRVIFASTDGTLRSGNLATGAVSALGTLDYDNNNLNPQYTPSPDGARVAFLKSGALYAVGTSGGASTLLGLNVSTYYNGVTSEPGAFSMDGSRFFFRTSTGLMVADLRTGTVQSATSSSPTSLRVTPDRSTAVALGGNALTVTRLSPSSSTTTPIDTGISDFVMAADGSRIVYRTTGSPSVVKQLLLTSNSPVTLGTNVSSFSGFSLDNRQFLLEEYDSATATYFLVNYELMTSARRVLWSGTGNSAYAMQYSANGAWVVFQVGSTLYSVSSSGTGLRSLVTVTNCCITQVLPTNDRVGYVADVAGNPKVLHVTPLPSGATITMGSGVSSFEFTPDGSRIVFLQGETLRVNNAVTGANEGVLWERAKSFKISQDGASVLLVDVTGQARVVKLATKAAQLLADRVVHAAWMDNTRVVLVRDGSPPPSKFQDGVYVATVP